MLHSKVWQSKQFYSISPLARLLYIGMITLGDDEGRLRGEAIYLRSTIFLFDKFSPKRIKKLRDEIYTAKLIDVYETEGGEVIQHPNWKKYQQLRIDRIKPSDLPVHEKPTILQPTDNQTSAQGNGSEEKRNEMNDVARNPGTGREQMEAARKATVEQIRREGELNQK